MQTVGKNLGTNCTKRRPSGPAKVRAIRGCFRSFEASYFSEQKLVAFLGLEPYLVPSSQAAEDALALCLQL
jgi:hypothetical protein